MGITSVDGFTPQSLIKNVRLIGGGPNFLLNFLFTGGQTHPTEAINLAEAVGYVRVLPIVGRDEPAVPLELMKGSAKAVVPPRLRVSKTLNEAVAMTPFIGGDSWEGMNTDLNRSLAERITREQVKTKLSFGLTLETWCADLLADGAVSLADVDGTARYTLDYGYVTTGTAAARNVQTAKTGTNAWNSDQSDPIAHMDEWETQIRDYSDYAGPLVVVCGSNVAAALRNHAKVQALLDNRRMQFGQINPAAANNYFATLGNFDLYKYSKSRRGAKNAPTLTQLWDPNTVGMVPEGGNGIFEIHYGAIYEAPGGRRDEIKQLIQTDWYSKMYSSDDPPADILINESRPLPAITDARPIRICQVIPEA